MLESTLAALGRHRWLAAMAILIPFTGAVVLALSLPGLYRATATILVQRDQPVSGGTPAQPADVETRLRTIREEVLSRRRLDALVEKFGLYPELRGRAHREASIDRMRKDIQIQLKGPDSGAAPSGTIAFSLGFRGADPVLAASVANALAESYVQENLRISGRQARGAAEALEAQLSEVAKRLDEQEVQIVQYQTAHNGELPQQLVVNMARMQQLEMQLQINRETRLRYLDRADFAGRQAADPRYAGVSGNPETPAARLARLKQELADLRATYHDNYPDIARISKEISALEARPEDGLPDTTARLSKAAPARADPTIRVLESEEDRLRREIGIYRARVDRAPQREQEFARMSRDHSTTKELYSTLLKRYQEAKIADDLERERKGGQLRILDSAIVPPAPYAPNRGRLMLFALMASLAFAVGVVALAERIDTSFHSVDDLRSFTRVPVLVSIPPLSSRADRWRNRWQFAWRALVTLTGLVLIGAATWSIAHGNLDLAHLLARGGTS